MPSSTPSAVFEQLHERVRRWVWQQGWSELRDAQEAAIPPILAGDRDVIISAATAGGKTEAAFLPICSKLVGRSPRSVQALYVSPLKALINDQFDRLENLCAQLEIRVHRWHGDVNSSQKRRVIEDPSGILLITPESLEALFVLRGSGVSKLLGGLEYIVVDELHSFLGVERGRQLQSLLHRTEAAVSRRIPRVGLSATLGNMALAADFLRPGERDGVTIIESAAEGQEIKLQVRGYQTPKATEGALARSVATASAGGDADEPSTDVCAIAVHLFQTLRGTHNLVFANARSNVELFADVLRSMAAEQRIPNEFWPHHGSLSRELRQDVERMLKERSQPVSVICTTTLEMGIDIGSMTSIAQIGPPPSVSSLRQRLGRSGRRGDPAILRVYIQEDQIDQRSAPGDLLRERLVQTIAMVDLMVQRWCEPPPPDALHLSTLVQQLLSVIAQYGGVSASKSWRVLCEEGPFRSVNAVRFAELLRCLGRAHLIVQSSEGIFLLGTKGERIVNHYSFYAAFATPEEYRLVSGTKTLGTLPIVQPLIAGSFLIFAGRRWRILSVDLDQKVVELTAASGGRVPRFGGEATAVDDRVRAKMRSVLESSEQPVYADAAASLLLDEARREYARMGLTGARLIFHDGDTFIFPWRGDRVMATLLAQLVASGLTASKEGMAIRIDRLKPAAVRERLHAISKAGISDPMRLAAAVANKPREKYDAFLDEDLLCADFASRQLDPEGAAEALGEILTAG